MAWHGDAAACVDGLLQPRRIMHTTRDHRKLRVFGLADTLVVDVYRATRRFPDEERFGLQAQVRRAAVSVPTNIVEGSARITTADYCKFLNIATASAAEAQYLLDLSARLEMLTPTDVAPLLERYDVLLRGLKRLVFELQRRT
jgi:four helix bundle protein